MSEENNKKLSTALGIASLGVIPFVASVIQFFKKSGDQTQFVTYKDLLIVLGLQAAIAAALAAKVIFFNNAILK